MASVLTGVVSRFWSEEVWLPPNITWDSFNEPQVVNQAVVEPKDFARFSDLWYPIPLAFFFILLRHGFEKLVFKPLGIYMGLKDHKRPVLPDNPVLDTASRTGGKEDVKTLASRTGMSEIQVSRWFRQRRLSSQPNTLQKFCETGWRWVYYTCVFLYGITCLWDKPWFWNIRHCWYNYPYHQIDHDIWVYYMVEMAFYWSLSITQFFDVKRKDFWEMFVHHNTTIALLMFSWTAHFTRIGTLVLIVHDCSDHLLELAKMLRYTKLQKACDIVFIMFSVTWLVTRCGVYPSWILYSTLHDATGYIEMFPAYYIFNGLLATLQLLHLLWTYFLIKAIHKALIKGNIGDERSDSEPSEDEHDDELKKDY